MTLQLFTPLQSRHLYLPCQVIFSVTSDISPGLIFVQFGQDQDFIMLVPDHGGVRVSRGPNLSGHKFGPVP